MQTSLIMLVAAFAGSIGIARAADGIGEFCAYWADAWHEGFQSSAEVNDLVSNARATKCNAGFVQARRRSDAFYRGSALEPVSRTVASNFDLLGSVIQAAHDGKAAAQVEVRAW